MSRHFRLEWKQLTAVLFGLVFVWFIHGSVPFFASPTLGQAVWTTGFSQSFAKSSLFAIHADHFGGPAPASIAFGLAGAYPAGLLIAAGLHPSDAYSAMIGSWIALAFWGAYRIGRLWGAGRYLSVLSAVLWLSLPIMWAHAGYSMVSTGIALLAFYFYSLLKLLQAGDKPKRARLNATIIFLVACIIAVFMDGYSFMMFAVGASIIVACWVLVYPERRQYFLRHVAGVHVLGFLTAYALYSAYIGKAYFDPAPIDFFRGWGADLTFLLVPTRGIVWLWDVIGFSVSRSSEQFFGDSSVWKTTFSLPLIVAGVMSWLLVRRLNRLASAFLLVALFGFYMSLGPSLKINSIKPEPMGRTMPADLAIAATGSAFLSKHVPGFNNMRAAYRWAALGVFSVWVLLTLGLARLDHQGRERFGAAFVVLLIVMFLPNMHKKWSHDVSNREAFFQIDRDLVGQLAEDIREGEWIAFLPYRNDFLVNYLAPTLGVRTYNIGGDKNLAEARKHWPPIMRGFEMGEIDDRFTDRVLMVLASGEASAVVLPFIDLLWAAHRWPYPAEHEPDLEPVIKDFHASGYLDITRRKHYAVVRLNKEFASAASMIMDETCLPPVCLERDRFRANTQRRVGELQGRQLATDGREGFLLFGPYVPMESGSYRFRLYGHAEKLQGAWVDVAAGKGTKTFGRFSIKAAVRGANEDVLAEGSVRLEEAVDDLEVRVYVTGKDVLYVTGYELRRE